MGRKIGLVMAVFCLASILSACGQTGSLYLPEKEAPQNSNKEATK